MRDVDWNQPLQSFDGRHVQVIETILTKSGIDPFDAPHKVIRYFNENGKDSVNIVRAKTGYCGYALTGAPHPDTIINVPDKQFPPKKGVILEGWSAIYQDGIDHSYDISVVYDTKEDAQRLRDIAGYSKKVAVVKVKYEFDIGEGL